MPSWELSLLLFLFKDLFNNNTNSKVEIITVILQIFFKKFKEIPKNSNERSQYAQ